MASSRKSFHRTKQFWAVLRSEGATNSPRTPFESPAKKQVLHCVQDDNRKGVGSARDPRQAQGRLPGLKALGMTPSCGRLAGGETPALLTGASEGGRDTPSGELALARTGEGACAHAVIFGVQILPSLELATISTLRVHPRRKKFGQGYCKALGGSGSGSALPSARGSEAPYFNPVWLLKSTAWPRPMLEE